MRQALLYRLSPIRLQPAAAEGRHWQDHHMSGLLSRIEVTQDDCHCRRCQRRDNIVKYGRVFEKLGGDTERLVQDSPISTLCSRILAMASPKIDKDNEVTYKKATVHSHKNARKNKSGDQFNEEEIDFLKACLTSRYMEILYDITKLVKVSWQLLETRDHQTTNASKLDRWVLCST